MRAAMQEEESCLCIVPWAFFCYNDMKKKKIFLNTHNYLKLRISIFYQQ